jgi:hypothetical protein
MRVALALALVIGCGKPAAEPVPPEPAPEVAAEIDAGVLYNVRPAPEVEVSPQAHIGGGLPAGPGDAMPTMPPPPCTDPGLRAEETDLNGDGRADVRKLFAGAVMVCKLADLNMDGSYDIAQVEDPASGRRLEYMDLDFDGRVDAGVEYDMSTGARLRTLRDTDADGLADTVDPQP